MTHGPHAGRHCAAGFLFTLSFPLFAVGGHHVIDDAAILDPGTCHIETWAQRTRSVSGVLTTITPACHVGGFELGVSIDQDRTEGVDVRSLSPDAKWATPVGETQWAIGAFIGLNYQSDTRRWEGYVVNLPVTLDLDAVAVHFNVGYDGVRGGGGMHRTGVAMEWAVIDPVELMSEVYREFNASSARVGARYLVGALSLDLSYAESMRSGGPKLWTGGLTLEF